MIASCRGRKLKNGLEYTIVELGEKIVEVVETESGKEISLRRLEFFRSMRLKYAMTYASAQGLTIEGLLMLHDTGHRHFTWRHLYVGLSRATGWDKVVVN